MKKRNDNALGFDAIVKKNHTLVFRTVLGFVHVREDAEDLTQEVFISAWQNIGNFRGDAQVSTWLYRIAVNTSLNFIAQRRRKKIIQTGEDTLRFIFNRAGDTQTPHRMLEADEERETIQKAIDSLPGKQRKAFVLTRMNDLPQKEVAEIMNTSQRAVEQLLLRAKANLSKKLEAPHKKM
jgi:RNA polymerase sigma-70 factor (ECF subfamily)